MATSNSVEKAEEQGLYIYKKEDLDNKKEVGGCKRKRRQSGHRLQQARSNRRRGIISGYGFGFTLLFVQSGVRYGSLARVSTKVSFNLFSPLTLFFSLPDKKKMWWFLVCAILLILWLIIVVYKKGRGSLIVDRWLESKCGGDWKWELLRWCCHIYQCGLIVKEGTYYIFNDKIWWCCRFGWIPGEVGGAYLLSISEMGQEGTRRRGLEWVVRMHAFLWERKIIIKRWWCCTCWSRL